MTYELLIAGGRVVDPSVGLDEVRDVAVSGGRIAAVEPSIDLPAAATIDARGMLVVPGLIDIHTHVSLSPEGPDTVLRDGVTGWVDAGSRGADGIAEVAAIARSSPQRGRVLVNIGRGGLLPEGDTVDLARADVAAARDAIAEHRDVVVGVKARLSHDVTSDDREVLRRAQEAASPFGLPVMVHIGQTRSPIGRLMGLLRPGDIVSHMFAPPPNAIVDERGRIDPEVLAARRRGVLFDVGNGLRGHLRWDTVRAIMDAGFPPDTFSTDWTPGSPTSGVIDLPNCMSKLLGFGMTVGEAIACATLHPSRTFPAFAGRGTLNVGAPADVTLLELRDGEFSFLDNYGGTITGTQRLFPAGTVLGGTWTPAAPDESVSDG